MLTPIAKDGVAREFFIGRYELGVLANLPWGHEPFDCVVFLCNDMWHSSLDEISRALADTNSDWIQVAGPHSMDLHDAVDQASVDIGRQATVGDGVPMTSWHDDAVSFDEMADIAALCFGAHERVLILVVGQEQDLDEAHRAVRTRIRPGDQRQ
jgi:hypothetical protein